MNYQEMSQQNGTPLCTRCKTPVTFKDVTPGYYAVCPHHDEDLLKIEVEFVVQ